MNATFNVGGHEFTFTNHGHLVGPDGRQAGGSGVGIQVVHFPLGPTGTEPAQTQMQVFVAPSQARAIASALLAAATEARA